MKDRIKDIIRKNLDAIGIFVFMLCVFSYIMFVIKWKSDLWEHVNIANEMLEEHRLFSTNFLMYFLVNVLTFFTGYKYPMRAALVLLISLANTAKYVLVRNAFSEWTTAKTAKLASFAMLFVYIIPLKCYLKPLVIFISSDNLYLGYYVPNVWHNSTILCMMPFAIACYLWSVKQFEEYSETRNKYITLFLVLSVLVKPSFYFVYVIAYPIIILNRYGIKKEFFKSLLPLLAGGLCLIYEYMTIYYNGGNDGSGVVIDIMQLFTIDFWKSHGLYLVVSMSLPLLFLILYARDIYKDREFWFVLIMAICGIGMMWCCKETGPRAAHGNFNWQAIAAMWFVYLYILKTTIRATKSMLLCHGWGIREKLCYVSLVYMY
ncbi:MAG: hypothetical protein IJ834_03080 [Paludibacteraceae bacterium]|nr:hypothetical protein [Paludibacteraceae bacterium]